MGKYVFGMLCTRTLNFLNDLWLRANNNPSCPYVTYSNIFFFVCKLLPLALFVIYTKAQNTMYTFTFFILRVTLNTFRHISTCSKTKESKNLMLAFLIHFTIFSFLIFTFFCSFLTRRALRSNAGFSTLRPNPSTCHRKRKNTTQQRQSHHDRRKCGKSFS